MLEPITPCWKPTMRQTTSAAPAFKPHTEPQEPSIFICARPTFDEAPSAITPCFATHGALRSRSEDQAKQQREVGTRHAEVVAQPDLDTSDHSDASEHFARQTTTTALRARRATALA